MDITIKETPLIKCHSCGRILLEGRWTKSKGRTALKEYIKKTILLDKIIIQKIQPENALEGKMPKKILLFLSSNTNEEESYFDVPVKTKNKLCDLCEKSQGQYFEGFLQLREANKEQIEYAKKLVLQKGAIKKEQIKNHNADFTISSNKAIIHAIRELSKTYSGISNVTSTLHTKDKLTSKELHRVTGLFRFIDLKKEDIIIFEDKYYYVTGIDKKNINLQSLSKKSQKKSISLSLYDSLERVNTFETTILREKPVLMILDENYQPQPAFSFGKIKKNKTNVRAVRTNEGLFLVP